MPRRLPREITWTASPGSGLFLAQCCRYQDKNGISDFRYILAHRFQFFLSFPKYFCFRTFTGAKNYFVPNGIPIGFENDWEKCLQTDKQTYILVFIIVEMGKQTGDTGFEIAYNIAKSVAGIQVYFREGKMQSVVDSIAWSARSM